jgi:hypothetical protein
VNEEHAKTRPSHVQLTYVAEGGIQVERLRKILEMIYLMEPHGVSQQIVSIGLNDHRLHITLQD